MTANSETATARWRLLTDGERTRLLCEALVYAGAVAGYGSTADGVGCSEAQADAARTAVLAYRETCRVDFDAGVL